MERNSQKGFLAAGEADGGRGGIQVSLVCGHGSIVQQEQEIIRKWRVALSALSFQPSAFSSEFADHSST